MKEEITELEIDMSTMMRVTVSEVKKEKLAMIEIIYHLSRD
jgi:hypothetical protein